MDPTQTQVTELLIRRRRSAIMAADVAGYSRLMGTDEDNTLKRLDAARRIMDQCIARHGGRIANTAGDSVIAEFMQPTAAVHCAVEVQTALRRRNKALPRQEQLEFRIGINYGEVIANRADLLGDSVNVAARIENLAQPGGVLISESMYEQVYGRIDLTFRALGEQALKNISRKIVVYEVVQDDVASAMPAAPAAPARSPARPAEAAVAPPPRRSWPLLAGLGVIVLAAVGGIAYLATTQLLPPPEAVVQGPAEPAPPAPAPAVPATTVIAPAPPTAAGPDLERLAADANAALAGFACARLRAAVSAGGAIAVAGYVAAAADADRAVAGLAALPEAGDVTREIAVLPPPLCTLLGGLPADAGVGGVGAPQLGVGGDGGRYKVGESILVTARATAAYDGYLYVDYVDAAEQYVVHLLPSDLRPDNRVAAGRQVTIGDMPAEIERYRIKPPLGTNMIVVMSSRHPLHDGSRPQLEKIAEYLPKLQQMLAPLGPRDLHVAWQTVVFVER